MEKIHYAIMSSPLGDVLVAGGERGLRRVGFLSGNRLVAPQAEWICAERPLHLEEPLRQLEEYFSGTRREFELSLDPRGTPFQQKVWRELREIAFGETISYGDLARRIGQPGASRAVGAANGRNPLPVVVPCHRVIGHDGALTGYGGGLPIKEALLTLEGARPLPSPVHQPSLFE